MEKNIILLFVAMSFFSFAQTPCPPEGTAKLYKDQVANQYKNRDIVVSQIDSTVTLEKMLADGPDYTRFNPQAYVEITGYLVLTRLGGKESCNCGASIDSMRDNHIYIGLTPHSLEKECVIVEITPKFKKKHPRFDLKYMVGKKVRVRGYLFCDMEHKANAVNTCTSCGSPWRKTIWEVHPVVLIELIK